MNLKVKAILIILLCCVLLFGFTISAGCTNSPDLSFSKQSSSSSESSILSGDANTAKVYLKAMEPRNPAVRSFAMLAIKSTNAGDYNIGQVCDIYDKISKSWKNVNNPSGNDPVVKASESVKYMKGDSEDHAVLMASCIEAIGGTSRIINTKNSKGEVHAYAEVLLTTNQETKKSLLNSLSRRYSGKTMYCHADSQNDGKTGYWLNLDYAAGRPGGEFFESTGNKLIVYSNGNYKQENSQIIIN